MVRYLSISNSQALLRMVMIRHLGNRGGIFSNSAVLVFKNPFIISSTWALLFFTNFTKTIIRNENKS